jgi:AAA+ superfamily predicted ATPase
MIQDILENPVLSAVDTIFSKGHRSKFSDTYQKSVLKEAQVICDYLGIDSLNQAMAWGMLFGMGVQSNSALDIDQFSNYLNVTVIRAFQFSKELDSLAKRKLLQKQKGNRRRRGGESLQYLNFFVPGDIVQAVVSGEPLPPRRQVDIDCFQLLALVEELFEQRYDGYFSTDELGTEIQEILEENKKLPFVKQVLDLKLSFIDQIILLMVCNQFVQGYQSVELIRLLKTIYANETQKQLACRKEWINNKTKLQKLNLVDLESEADFRNDKAIQLTLKGQELFGNDRSLLIEQDQPKAKDILLSSSIVEQKLFFNEREQGELSFLQNLLQPNQYNEVVERLKSNRMKGNFTILFSGQAGTGKTESVYQIARNTGRDIKMVDISKTKSKWFGESEKLIVGVFASFKRLAATSKLTPILFFNEADGIFSSRQTGDESSVRQTENSMQTCLLQAMEDFEGILIATTNVPLSLKEFERRFLYKITFDKPDSSTRFKILKDKIPFLPDDQIYQISETYKLTGGQIANLAKKVIMQQVLTGKYPDMGGILRLCDSEFLVKPNGRSQIGFKVGFVGKNTPNNRDTQSN